MAATGVAVLDDAYLGGNAFGHGVGMADYAYFLSFTFAPRNQVRIFG